MARRLAACRRAPPAPLRRAVGRAAAAAASRSGQIGKKTAHHCSGASSMMRSKPRAMPAIVAATRSRRLPSAGTSTTSMPADVATHADPPRARPRRPARHSRRPASPGRGAAGPAPRTARSACRRRSGRDRRRCRRSCHPAARPAAPAAPRAARRGASRRHRACGRTTPGAGIVERSPSARRRRRRGSRATSPAARCHRSAARRRSTARPS